MLFEVIVDWRNKRKKIKLTAEEEDLGKGNLFATGLVAGGALAGVIVAILSVNDKSKCRFGKDECRNGTYTNHWEEKAINGWVLHFLH